MSIKKREIANYYDLAVPKNASRSKPSSSVSSQKVQRATSTSILEKYTSIHKKVEEIQERKERSRRLKEKFDLKLEKKEDGSPTNAKNSLPSPNFENFYNMSPRTHRNNILKSRNKLHTRTWSSIETQQQLYNYEGITNQENINPKNPRRSMLRRSSSLRKMSQPVMKYQNGARTVSPVPEGQKDSDLEFNERLKFKRLMSLKHGGPVPDAIQDRVKRAEEKRKERLMKLKALDEDCLHAKQIITKLQSHHTRT